MSMQHLETEFRRQGKGNLADIIAAVHKLNGSDIPFSSVAATAKKQAVKSPEVRVEIKRFSAEQREALEKQGFVIYGLTGQSIKTLRDSGHKLRLGWDESLPDFEALGSMHSEVAINPSKPFLPTSNNKILAQQEKMVEKFSQELGKKVPGVKAIIGQAPDYGELAFLYLDATKECLFVAKDNYDYARTRTLIGGSIVAIVRLFSAGNGLDVDDLDAVDGNYTVHAVPLVVPASNA